MSLLKSCSDKHKIIKYFRILALVAIGTLLVVTIKTNFYYEASPLVVKESKLSNFVYTWDEEKYIDYTMCKKKENVTDWKDLYLDSEAVESENVTVPKNLEETAVGLAPSIPTEFFIEEADFCLRKPKLKAIAIVHSAIKNVERRSVTRRTWGSPSDEFAVAFVMGRTSNKEEEDIVAKESQLYHDIVQGNYSDLYRFLTYKSLNSLYWVTKNCKHVQWVVKADDDTLLDVKKYLHFIDFYKNTPNFSKKMFCEFACGHHVSRSQDKWAISEQEFPYNDYPTFCQGTMWLASVDVLKTLLNVVPLVKYVWIDDVLVTGLMAMKANVSRYRINVPLSTYSLKDVGKVMAWSQIESERLDLWRDINRFYNPQNPSAYFDDISI